MNADLLLARVELHERAAGADVLAATLAFLADRRIDLTGPAAVGFAAVLPITASGGWFDLDDAGVSAFVFETLGADAETVEDIAAFPIANPTHLVTMFNHVAVLGESVARNPATYVSGRPLRVFGTALDWLRHDGQGVVVVDPLYASPVLSRAPGFLAADDRAHARWLASKVGAKRDRLLLAEAA